MEQQRLVRLYLLLAAPEVPDPCYTPEKTSDSRNYLSHISFWLQLLLKLVFNH